MPVPADPVSREGAEERVTLYRCGTSMEWKRPVRPLDHVREAEDWVRASRLEAVEAERDTLVADIRCERQEIERLLEALGETQARAEKAEEALREIAEHDWTAPPSVMPDEMAREALASHPEEPK